MQNQLDNVDFINSINDILEEFCETPYDTSDKLNAYVVFEFEDVMAGLKAIENGETAKPIIHFWLNNDASNAKVYGNVGQKVEPNNLFYSVYIVTNDLIDNSPKKNRFLNKIAGQLKYKFDYYGYKLPFKNIKINSSSGMLGKDSNSLYSCQQRLTFEIIKEV